MDDEIRRYLDVLQVLVTRSGKSKRDIERRLGWSKGSVSKLFSGHWEIKLRHILETLRAVEVEPLVFYRLVYRDLSLADRLMEELSPQAPGPDPVLLPPAMSEGELDRRIEEAVEKALLAREERSTRDSL